MIEAVVALCILFFAFFALLQICDWCISTLFCQYSAFYGTKGIALGYPTNIALRAVRVAAIGISGPLVGTSSADTLTDEKERAQEYMVRGDASGLWYQHWGPTHSTSGPQLKFGGSIVSYGAHSRALVQGTVTLTDAPLLSSSLATPLGIDKNPELTATVSTVSNQFLLEE